MTTSRGLLFPSPRPPPPPTDPSRGRTSVAHPSSCSGGRCVALRPGWHAAKDAARRTACEAHRSKGRSFSSVGGRRGACDDLVTPQGRYPSAWAVDLATIFGWDDVLDASGVVGGAASSSSDCGPASDDTAAAAVAEGEARRVLLPKRIALDGANIAWSLGTTVRSRFKCRQFPLSAGVVRALEYEPWLRQGFDVVAFIPKEYVIGGLQSLADGGGRATLNADKVKYVGKGVWVNTELMDLVDAGKVRMVSRGAGTEGRKSDDLTIIEYAKENNSWICSNDQFRDHRRNRSLGFSGARDLKAFARMRRFEHSFRVAPGLDDDLLRAMREASGWEPRVGVEFATCQDGRPVPPPKFRKKPAKRVPERGIEDDMMASMMDDMIVGGGGGRDSKTRSAGRDAAAAKAKEEEEEDDDEGCEPEFDSGRPTRNDNPNALNGVDPYYAMPQETLPVFFEPTPTAAMIAARKTFLERQGWSMATMAKK